MSSYHTVRPALISDLQKIVDIYNYYILNSHATFVTKLLTVEERYSWFNTFSQGGRYRLLVLDLETTVVGYALSKPYRTDEGFEKTIETGIYLEPSSTGKGYGTLLYGQLFEDLRSEKLHRAVAGVALPNDKSVNLHRKFNFIDVGIFSEYAQKFNRYWSSLWLEKAL